MKTKYLLFCFVLCSCVGTVAHNQFGEEYLGARYMASPLGEGFGIDPDPLIREDAFDCMTFVETSLAQGNLEKLNKIRYKNGKPDFIARNHFIELDWLQNNADMVENISGQFGETAVRSVVIDKKSWFKAMHNIKTSYEPEIVELEYLPYSNLPEINNDETLIVLFIVGKSEKTDTIGTDLAVAHMGFVLPGGKILRHASSDHERVEDVDFESYNAWRAKKSKNLGIALLKIKL